MKQKTVRVQNSIGLQARPAALFVQASGKFASNVWLSKDGKKVNAKSIMGLMSISAGKDDVVTIAASGTDEDNAVETLSQLVERGLPEA